MARVRGEARIKIGEECINRKLRPGGNSKWISTPFAASDDESHDEYMPILLPEILYPAAESGSPSPSFAQQIAVAKIHKTWDLFDEDDLKTGNSLMFRDLSSSLSMGSYVSATQSEKMETLDYEISSKDQTLVDDDDDSEYSNANDESMTDSDSSEGTDEQLVITSEDGSKLKEEVLRFIANDISIDKLWKIRKELKRLKRKNNYFSFGKQSPLAAVLMHDVFCLPLEK